MSNPNYPAALFFAAVASLTGAPQAALAQDFVPCQGPVWWAESDAGFSDFDFWIGVWQVFDRKTGLMVGLDDVEKELRDCVIVQNWTHMNDIYTAPGSTLRMQGMSFTGLAVDGLWHQTWVDNNGFRVSLVGELDDKGAMVLESDWLEFNNRNGTRAMRKYRWHWDPREDGTVHNFGYRKDSKEGDWISIFDIIYRRNAPGGPTAIYADREQE